jgi:hypothetical protein
MEGSREKLIREIVALSYSDNWVQAKKEWSLELVYFSSGEQHCLCGQLIKECCVLTNIKNSSSAIVGNVCVNKFMEIESDKIFKSVKKIQKDLSKSLNKETINYAHQKNWINTWERDFYLNISHRRKLSEKQNSKLNQVNKKIINNIIQKT